MKFLGLNEATEPIADREPPRPSTGSPRRRASVPPGVDLERARAVFDRSRAVSAIAADLLERRNLAKREHGDKKAELEALEKQRRGQPIVLGRPRDQRTELDDAIDAARERVARLGERLARLDAQLEPAQARVTAQNVLVNQLMSLLRERGINHEEL